MRMKTSKTFLYLGELLLLQIIYYTGWYCEKNYIWGGSMLLLTLLMCGGLGGMIWETFQALDTRIKTPAKWLALIVVITMSIAYISIPLYYGSENLQGEKVRLENSTGNAIQYIQDIYPQ